MKIILAGEEAIGRKHITALRRIDDVEVVALAGGISGDTEAFADEFGIERWTTDLSEALALEADAAILATPTQLHAAHATETMRAGKHVLVEIPMADNLADSEELVRVQQETGVTAMVCHTRRFNPSHQWVHDRVRNGELTLQHLVVATLYFRRENRNAMGKPRTWTDHLLWHHSCHTVDLTGVAISDDGIELPDREFISAIIEGREPNASVAQCLGAMEAIDMLEKSLGEH